MNTLKEILHSVRQRSAIAEAPPHVETLIELLDRVDCLESRAIVTESMYFDLCRHHQPIVARLPNAFFRLHHADDAVRSFWIERTPTGPMFLGTRLIATEQAAFVRIMGPRILDTEGQFSMVPTGFGPFPIHWLSADEPFVDVLDRPGVVTGRRTEEKCEVVLFPGTIRATRQAWLQHVCVFVPKFAVAANVRKRQRQLAVNQPADASATV